MDKAQGSVHSSFWSNLFKQAPKSNELLELMKEIPPFVSLPKKSLKALLQIVHHRNYISGEHIFYQGDPGLGLYIILEGEVKIQYFSPKGKKVTLANMSNGDFFGELALLDGEKRSASAVASKDCKIAIIFKPDLDEYILKNTKDGVSILHGISKIIITRLRHLNNEFLSLHDSVIDDKENSHELTN